MCFWNRENEEKLRVCQMSDRLTKKLIVLASGSGVITIKGENLHVEQLNLEHGQVELTGKIDSLVYTEEKTLGQKSESLLSRLFQ